MIIDQNSRTVYDVTIPKATNQLKIDDFNALTLSFVALTPVSYSVETTRHRNSANINPSNINLRDNLDSIYISYGIYNKSQPININQTLAVFSTSNKIQTCGYLGKQPFFFYLKSVRINVMIIH